MRNSTRFLLFVLLLLPGCTQQTPAAGDSAEGKVTVAFDPSWQTPTENEATRWAQALEAAVKRNDVAAYNELVDWGAVLERATAGLPYPEGLRQRHVASLQEGLGVQLCRQVAAGTRFQFLHLHMRDSQRRALLRLVAGKASGPNYHDYLLAKEAGHVRAVDVYVFSLGALLSEAMHRDFLHLVAEQNKSFFAKLTGEESGYFQHLKEVDAMGQCVRNREPKKAVELFNQLPANVQKQKSVALVYLLASQQADKQLYREAMEKFAAWYPDDPGLNVILIDGYALSGEFEKLHRTIDRLDQAVGGDPYLQVFHCVIYCRQKRFADGESAARKAIAADPAMHAAYSAMLDASLGAKDFSATTDALVTLEQRFSMQPRDLRTVPLFADYVKSPEYQRWVKSHDRPAPQ